MTIHEGQTAQPPLRIEKLQGERAFRLVGEMDLSNSSWVKAVFDAEVRKRGDLMLDLGQLNFIDCTGRRVLAKLASALGPRGRLIVRNPTAVVERLLDLTDIDSVENLIIERTSHIEERLTESTSSMEGADAAEAKLWGLLALIQSMMPSADDASFTFTQAGELVTPVATSLDVEECDQVQYRIGEGPCVQAAKNGRTVNLSFAQDQRLLHPFVLTARARGFVGVLSTPIMGADRQPLGGLNLYSRSGDGFPRLDESQAEILATRAAWILQTTGSSTPEFA